MRILSLYPETNSIVEPESQTMGIVLRLVCQSVNGGEWSVHITVLPENMVCNHLLLGGVWVPTECERDPPRWDALFRVRHTVSQEGGCD